MLDALKEWTRWIVRWVFIFVVLSFLAGLLPTTRDDSDPAWPRHSGMEIRTDALTGCQYLASGSGGLTPRLNGTGKQVGCKP